MDRPLKLWEFLLGVIGMVIGMGTIVYNSGTMNGKNEVRLTNLETDVSVIKADSKEQYKELNKKMDYVSDKVIGIQIILQDKQDRKK